MARLGSELAVCTIAFEWERSLKQIEKIKQLDKYQKLREMNRKNLSVQYLVRWVIVTLNLKYVLLKESEAGARTFAFPWGGMSHNFDIRKVEAEFRRQFGEMGVGVILETIPGRRENFFRLSWMS